MIVETRLFTYLSAFFFIVAIAYSICTGFYSDSGVEWAGATAMFLVGGLSLIIGAYFWFVAKRLSGPRPEDDSQATIEGNPEEVGFFSPGSIWPIIVAAGVLFVGASIALGYFWMIAIAVIFLISAASGLVFEYYRAPEKH